VILYSLICVEGHEFDSWFRDSAAYDRQIEKGLVCCPFCRSAKVSKAMMAPNVLRSDRTRSHLVEQDSAPRQVAFLDERHAELRAMIRELRETIIESTEDVGEKFAEEARRIQDGETARRSIRGRASLEEAKALLEDGIEILAIPGLRGDGN
jgi:hypothetical protein